MSGCAVMNKKESTLLQPRFVQADYFLCKVKEYELRYRMSWGQFFADFSSGRLKKDDSDYMEWAFLCRTFLPELIELEKKSPPGETNEIAEEPESNSGFFIAGESLCSIRKCISST